MAIGNVKTEVTLDMPIPIPNYRGTYQAWVHINIKKKKKI